MATFHFKGLPIVGRLHVKYVHGIISTNQYRHRAAGNKNFLQTSTNTEQTFTVKYLQEVLTTAQHRLWKKKKSPMPFNVKSYSHFY